MLFLLLVSNYHIIFFICMHLSVFICSPINLSIHHICQSVYIYFKISKKLFCNKIYFIINFLSVHNYLPRQMPPLKYQCGSTATQGTLVVWGRHVSDPKWFLESLIYICVHNYNTQICTSYNNKPFILLVFMVLYH